MVSPSFKKISKSHTIHSNSLNIKAPKPRMIVNYRQKPILNWWLLNFNQYHMFIGWLEYASTWLKSPYQINTANLSLSLWRKRSCENKINPLSFIFLSCKIEFNAILSRSLAIIQAHLRSGNNRWIFMWALSFIRSFFSSSTHLNVKFLFASFFFCRSLGEGWW